MKVRERLFVIGILMLGFITGACSRSSQETDLVASPIQPSKTLPSPTNHPAIRMTGTATPITHAQVTVEHGRTEVGATKIAMPTLTTQATQISVATQIGLSASCSFGLGLRSETAELFHLFEARDGLISSANMRLGQEYFPDLGSWYRIFSAPSLKMLEQKAKIALENEIPYEGLGYGLETSVSTPDEEWQELVASTQAAKAIAQQYGKQLIMAPGFRLMSENLDSYIPMAALSDGWILQTQRMQVYPAGDSYRNAVLEVVNRIRAGNPEIRIWAQITFPPDRDPDPEEWLAYHRSIEDLVEGTYIGIYIWDKTDTDVILNALYGILSELCGGQ